MAIHEMSIPMVESSHSNRSSIFKNHMTGWWYTYPSEKYESQLGLLFPIYGKIKHVPNHQPDEYSMFFHVESIYIILSFRPQV
jgi:hypothetical protein